MQGFSGSDYLDKSVEVGKQILRSRFRDILSYESFKNKIYIKMVLKA